jgi:hypothetical protein
VCPVPLFVLVRIVLVDCAGCLHVCCCRMTQTPGSTSCCRCGCNSLVGSHLRQDCHSDKLFCHVWLECSFCTNIMHGQSLWHGTSCCRCSINACGCRDILLAAVSRLSVLGIARALIASHLQRAPSANDVPHMPASLAVCWHGSLFCPVGLECSLRTNNSCLLYCNLCS